MPPTPDGTPSRPPPNTVVLPRWITVGRLHGLATVITLCVVGWLAARDKVAPTPPTDRPPATGKVDPGRIDPPTPPKPGARPALVLTADEYLRNFGPNFSAVGGRIASGELATRDAILQALGENAAPFNESLAAAIGKACSPSGTVDDKDGLAKVFKQVGDATGGK